jgi:hypothetical protein
MRLFNAPSRLWKFNLVYPATSTREVMSIRRSEPQDWTQEASDDSWSGTATGWLYLLA